MVRQIFKNKVICTAGPLEGQLTVDNLKRWTKLRKGEFTESFREDVTHLLCTDNQFKKRVSAVKDALKQRKDKRRAPIHIIHADWFEFCTILNTKVPEDEYSLLESEAREKARLREKKRIEEGKRNEERFVNTNFYHIYYDREAFEYRVDLTRDSRDVGERFRLELWESNATPHLYWFTVKYTKKKGARAGYHRDSPYPGKWRHQFDLFLKVFRDQTGIDWEQRLSRAFTMPDNFFQYAPPTGGKPVGRRLVAPYDECQDVNAQLRGLPRPLIEEIETQKVEEIEHDVGPVLYVEDIDETMSDAGPEERTMQLLEEIGEADKSVHATASGDQTGLNSQLTEEIMHETWETMFDPSPAPTDIEDPGNPDDSAIEMEDATNQPEKLSEDEDYDGGKVEMAIAPDSGAMQAP